MSTKKLERIMESPGVTGIDIRYEEGMYTVETRALSPVDEWEGNGPTLQRAINMLWREMGDAINEDMQREMLEEWAPKGSDFL